MIGLSDQVRAAVFGEVFASGETRFETDLQKILDGAQAAISALDYIVKPGSRTEQDAPIQTSRTFGAGMTWFFSKKHALTLEGGLSQGTSRVERAEYSILVELERKVLWASLMLGRRGRMLKGFEGWVQAGPAFSKADLLFQPGGAWALSMDSPPGRYRAMLVGGMIRFGLLIKVYRGLGLSLSSQALFFAPQDYVKPGYDLHLPVLLADPISGGFVNTGVFAKANPGGIGFRIGIVAPWGLK